jgi:RNA polymerase sigma-70 factor (ECF subfamily)
VDFEIVSSGSLHTRRMKREPPSDGGPADPSLVSQAIADLYGTHYRMVWGILGRAGVRRTAERCEVAHDVFIVAQQLYPERDPSAPLPAWLAEVAWNVARNFGRLKREASMVQPEVISPAASPEDVVVRRDFLVSVLEGLAHDRRVVFDMHEIEGFEVPEIARALGIPVGTASTRLRLAREHVEAAAARLQAGAARAEGRSLASVAILPFGVGAWRPFGQLFEDVPPDVEQQVWHRICRTIAAGGAVGRAAGVAVAGKVAAMLLGVGAVIGGGAVSLALRVLTPASPAAPAIVRAPDVVAVATPPASATASAPSALPPPVTAATSSPGGARSAPSAAPSVAGIDPEEARLIQQAQAAFARQDHAAARAALAEHAARFPRGQLVTERKRLLAQIPGGTRDASPGTMPAPSAPATGSASHRTFGTDE